MKEIHESGKKDRKERQIWKKDMKDGKQTWMVNRHEKWKKI